MENKIIFLKSFANYGAETKSFHIDSFYGSQ